jgi:hypothetical protein
MREPMRRGDDCLTTFLSGLFFLIFLVVAIGVIASCIDGS